MNNTNRRPSLTEPEAEKKLEENQFKIWLCPRDIGLNMSVPRGCTYLAQIAGLKGYLNSVYPSFHI